MDDIILFRIGERLTLTAAVLLVALVVMVGFWRTVQKVDISDGGRIGLAGSVVFSTPVFVLLAIIGYAWVSLEHPITVAPQSAPSGERALADRDDGGAFIGATPLVDEQVEKDAGYDLAVAERRLRSLNCLAEGQAPSARVQDDLAQVKLALMAPVWQPEWGPRGAFADWASGRSTGAPDPDAQAVYDRLHVAC